MPIPANNPGGTAAPFIDRTLVSAKIQSLFTAESDLAAPFASEYTAPINGQKTSSVMVRTKMSLQLTAMPANRNGLLPRTDIIPGGEVEVGLTDDEYFKVGIDTLGVEPGVLAAQVGEAGGEAILAKSNLNLLTELEAQGTEVDFAFSGATTGQEVWSALLSAVTTQLEANYTNKFVLYIRVGVWQRLLENVSVLSGSGGDPQARAAQLLGVSQVRVVALPTASAILAHTDAVAQAKVLSGIRTAVEDFDEIVEGRIKVGTTVLDANAVLVLKDIV